MKNVLIACEESQRVCTEFRRLGANAFSCDIQPCSGGHPEWHIQCNAEKIKNGYTRFITEDGGFYFVDRWDLIIAHPPCTYLSAAGAVRLFDKNHNIKDRERFIKGLEAKNFFLSFLNAQCKHICVENPVPLKVYCLPSYNQIIEPFYFGDPWHKKTCLWLYGLPPLKPTNQVEPVGYWISAYGHNKCPNGMSKGFRDQKTRSKTFPGIAKAMAEQWIEVI